MAGGWLSRRMLGNLLALGVGTLASLLILEVGLRVLDIQPRPGPFDPNVVDPILGMKPIRSHVQKGNFPEHQGVLIQQTNNMGFYQSQDTPPNPTPGVVRTVVLGDSFTAGATNADESFPEVLEQLLNRAGAVGSVEVLNAGAGRYSPYHCYVRFMHEILPLKPGRVLVAQYVGNDFLDMIRQDDRPYLTIEANGAFKEHPPRFITYNDPTHPPSLLDHTRTLPFIRSLAGPTLLYQASRVRLLYENLSTFGYGPLAIASYLKQIFGLDRIAHGMMLQILNQQVWFENFPETMDTSLKISRHTIKLFRDACRRAGIDLTYTVVPSKEMIEPEDMSDVFARLRKYDPKWTREKVAALDERLTDSVQQACSDLGVHYIDLRSGLKSRKRGIRMYYPADMHMSPEGNRAVAEILANKWPGYGGEARNSIASEGRKRRAAALPQPTVDHTAIAVEKWSNHRDHPRMGSGELTSGK